jgi:hypothetical protein
VPEAFLLFIGQEPSVQQEPPSQQHECLAVSADLSLLFISLFLRGQSLLQQSVFVTEPLPLRAKAPTTSPRTSNAVKRNVSFFIAFSP